MFVYMCAEVNMRHSSGNGKGERRVCWRKIRGVINICLDSMSWRWETVSQIKKHILSWTNPVLNFSTLYSYKTGSLWTGVLIDQTSLNPAWAQPDLDLCFSTQGTRGHLLLARLIDGLGLDLVVESPKPGPAQLKNNNRKMYGKGIRTVILSQKVSKDQINWPTHKTI